MILNKNNNNQGEFLELLVAAKNEIKISFHTKCSILRRCVSKMNQITVK